MYQLVDYVTREPRVAANLVFTGNNTPWEIVMDLNAIKNKLNLDYFRLIPPGISKYLAFMPINNAGNFISLTESATPLIRSKVLGKKLGLDLYFKVESKHATGSFKDRGSALEMAVAKEFSAKAMILASTGNMAASCACYAAAAKMPCYVLVPEGISLAKLAQVMAYGGHIVQIKGSYNDAAKLAYTIANQMGFYLGGDYAYRVEGQKTAAFEIIDQLYFQVPDTVIVPMGCGTNITAYAKGFAEYQQLGLINTLPRLVGVQAEGANAIVNSFQQKLKTITPLANVNTCATAIAVPDPIDGTKALNAIYSTNGDAIAVSDEAILNARYLLATEEGLFVESSAAATVAALMQAAHEGKYTNKKVVCVLTGDGLKDTHMLLETSALLPTISADVTEFLQLLNHAEKNHGSTTE
ncbi:threonine synthase [soil metagenome]